MIKLLEIHKYLQEIQKIENTEDVTNTKIFNNGLVWVLSCEKHLAINVLEILISGVVAFTIIYYTKCETFPRRRLMFKVSETI